MQCKLTHTHTHTLSRAHTHTHTHTHTHIHTHTCMTWHNVLQFTQACMTQAQQHTQTKLVPASLVVVPPHNMIPAQQHTHGPQTQHLHACYTPPHMTPAHRSMLYLYQHT